MVCSSKPLRHKSDIRILVLERGGSDDPIICSLHLVNLEQEPHYEALSYCWGLRPDSKEIQLDGAKIQVRENLHSALWHLRHQVCCRILWVNALCID